MKLLPFRWCFAAIAVATCTTIVDIAAAEALPRSATEPGSPGAVLSLHDAIEAALRYSPGLGADRAESGAGDARVRQAGLWPNPQLQVGVEDIGGSGDRNGVEQTETTFWVTQPIEIGGKLAQRRRVAELARRRLDYQTEARRLDVAAEVRRKFVGVLLAQERRKLADEIEGLSAAALRSVERRIEAGAASPTERAQARVSLGRARMESRTAEVQVSAARRQLATMWGSGDPTFNAVAGNLEEVASPPPLDDLIGALEHNPELARWDTEIERRGAVVSLERARRIPNINLSAGGRYFNDNDDLAAVFTFTVALPVFDRNQAGVLEAEQLVDKARAQRAAAGLAARQTLVAAHAELQTQFVRISALRDDVLADAKTASSEALESYRRGAAQARDVLAAQRVLFELQAEYFRTLADYKTTLIEVESLTAASADEEAYR